MSEASTSAKPIEFRGGKLTVTNAYLRETEPAKLADALHVMLGGMPDFFNGEAVVLDFRHLARTPDRIDWTGVLSLLRRYRVQPIGTRHLPAELAAGARQAGLAQLEEQTADAPPPEAVRREPASAAPQPAAESAPGGAPTMFVERSLRSGQQIYARDCDLVLLGGVSHGAEVIADGSIHCYGPLRGRALAGARGATTARILTVNFGPELVSIAGVYRTFERGIPESVAGLPAQVRLREEDQRQSLSIDKLSLD